MTGEDLAIGTGGDDRTELIVRFSGSDFDPNTIAADYRRLAKNSAHYVPHFAEFSTYWQNSDEDKMLAMVRTDGHLTGLASFSTFKQPRAIFLGGTRKIEIPLVQAALFGGTVVGKFDPISASNILTRLFTDLNFDMFAVPNLPLGNGVCEALIRDRVGWVRNVSKRNAARRLIRLPNTLDSYFASLKPSTTKATRRDLRMFRTLKPSYQIITSQDDVADFTRKAAAVTNAMQKYQRGGGGVSETSGTIEELCGLARQSRFRAFVATVLDEPVAYAWGDVANGVFYLRDTGYDPSLAKYSPGRAIILEAISNSIYERQRVFDFGIEDFVYKRRLSNYCLDGASVQISKTKSTRGSLTVMLHKTTDRLKLIIEQYRLK